MAVEYEYQKLLFGKKLGDPESNPALVERDGWQFVRVVRMESDDHYWMVIVKRPVAEG